MLVFRLLVFSLFLGACTTTPKGPVYLIRVEPGDSLAAIATKYDTNWRAIAELNDIDDPRDLKVGTVIRVIPGHEGQVPGAAQVTWDEVQEPTEPAANDRKMQEGAAARNRPRILFDTPGGDKLVWPVSGKLTSPYGPRGRRFHHGIDLSAPRGTPIRAAAAGKVIFAGWQRGYGRTVIIKHRGMKTLYAHCHRVLVRKNHYVMAGHRIGTVGRSGNATGYHLHFEVRRFDGRSINPMTFLRSGNLLSLRSK